MREIQIEIETERLRERVKSNIKIILQERTLKNMNKEKIEMDDGAGRIRFYKIKNQWTSFSKFQAIEEDSKHKN